LIKVSQNSMIRFLLTFAGMWLLNTSHLRKCSFFFVYILHIFFVKSSIRDCHQEKIQLNREGLFHLLLMKYFLHYRDYLRHHNQVAHLPRSSGAPCIWGWHFLQFPSACVTNSKVYVWHTHPVHQMFARSMEVLFHYILPFFLLRCC
jgi:hypothetical protein